MKTTRSPVAVFLLSLFLFAGCRAGVGTGWTEIKSFFSRSNSVQQDASLSAGPLEAASQPPREAQPAEIQLPVEDILQLPELPNGCEATSLAMLLQYLGFPADKMDIAENYLPREDVVLQDEQPCGPDPHNSFVGNPADNTGYYCFAQPIVTAANLYLADQESTLLARNVTGAGAEELVQHLTDGQPVIVWCTKEFAPLENSVNYWYLNTTGELYIPYSNLHCMVLCGYDEKTFYLRDPLNSELQAVERQTFLDSYASLNRQAVVIHEPAPRVSPGKR